MPRSTAAYLADIIEACEAIEDVLKGVDLGSYLESRAVRSSVEREFIIIGEAVGAITRHDPVLAAEIPDARLIVGFRNVLTHDYAGVDDEAVFGVAKEDLPGLRVAAASLLERVAPDDH